MILFALFVVFASAYFDEENHERKSK